MEITRDIEAIDNLNTAKMTLRWALERLSALEKDNAELRRRMEQSRSDLGAQASFAAEREAYVSSREAYYRKLEPLVSEFCKGRLDIRRLLEREVEAAQKEAAVIARGEALEREYAARCEALEGRQKRLAADLEARERERSAAEERGLSERRRAFDDAYITRELALRAGEHRIAQKEKVLDELREKLLAETQARKDENRREVERIAAEYERLREDLFGETRRQIADWEKERAEAAARGERAWAAERHELLNRLAQGERHAGELLARIAELENARIEETRRGLARGKDFSERLEAAEREYRLALEEQRRSFSRGVERRREELDRLEHALLLRCEDFEESARARDAAWLRREEALRNRDKAWREHACSVQEAAAETAARVGELKRELIDAVRAYRDRLAALEPRGDRPSPGTTATADSSDTRPTPLGDPAGPGERETAAPEPKPEDGEKPA